MSFALLALFVLGLLCTLIVIFVWITRGLYRGLAALIRNALGEI